MCLKHTSRLIISSIEQATFVVYKITKGCKVLNVNRLLMIPRRRLQMEYKKTGDKRNNTTQ